MAGMYTHGLIFPSLLGTMSAIWGAQFKEPDENGLGLYYSIFFAMWSISFLSSWKRSENEYKFLWGTEG